MYIILFIFQNSNEDYEVPKINDLLNEHKKRWAFVRQQWVKFGHENEARYADSKKMLRTMFDNVNYYFFFFLITEIYYNKI